MNVVEFDLMAIRLTAFVKTKFESRTVWAFVK